MTAVLAVNKQQTLAAILQQVVETARPLLHADYVAVGIYSATNQLREFIHNGIPQDTAKRISHPPVGLGLLAVMDDDNERPFSIARIADDPRSVGFPPHHPPMNALLAVPLIAHGVTVGRLYLTRKDAEPFSTVEQTVAIHFADHIAITIHNGRLLKTAQKDQRRMIHQNNRLRRLSDALLAIPAMFDLNKAMTHVTIIARTLLSTSYGATIVVVDGRLNHFTESMKETAVDRPPWIESVRETPIGNRLPTARFPAANITDDTLFTPISASNTLIGYFYLSDKVDGEQFSNRDYELIEMLAAHTAVIIQNAHAYEEVSRLAITAERARIGMDLHDGVIQSIYAVGLILESARMAAPDEATETDGLMRNAIDELNNTIRDIRNFILDLRPHRFDGNLKQALARLIREFQANTMISVSTEISMVTNILSTDASLAIFLTTQEALANIARHARATQVTLSVQHVEDQVHLHITDNGRGFDMEMLKKTTVGHGLSNMRSRTEELHGELGISSEIGKGTAVSLILPCLDA